MVITGREQRIDVFFDVKPYQKVAQKSGELSQTVQQLIHVSLVHPFTPPNATPAMMYFDRAKYTMNRGRTDRDRAR